VPLLRRASGHAGHDAQVLPDLSHGLQAHREAHDPAVRDVSVRGFGDHVSRSAVWRRDLERLAAEFGCDLKLAPGGHFRFRHPSGWFVTCSASPNDPKALRYVRSDLKRKTTGVWR